MGIILETKEPEKAWNALRFAVTGKRKGHEVKVFLMGEGVEVEGLHHERYPAGAVLKEFDDLGGEVLACGTCIKGRGMEATKVCPISTMEDCLEMVLWADQTVTF